ncbi:MAG: hypothetical protein H6951_19385 [Zoogloeaceae bacterium]|nr:hypothetical protein [Zoogloeaceae bacterium]
MRLAPTEHVLLLVLHHIIADGWSIGVLARELSTLYAAYAKRAEPTPPPLSVQYRGLYAVAAGEADREVLATQICYWQAQLADLSVLDLPTDHPRPAMQTFRGRSLAFDLSPAMTKALEALSQREGVTLYMTLLAAFQVLLARYSGQVDIAVGSPIANRNNREIEGLIGFL